MPDFGEIALTALTEDDARICLLTRPDPYLAKVISLSKGLPSETHPETLYVRMALGAIHILIDLGNANRLILELKHAVRCARSEEIATTEGALNSPKV